VDEPSRVEDLLARAVDEQVAEQRSWREAVEALTSRVGDLETAVSGLRHELAAVVEQGARAGVTGELEAVSAELRRQISDLGRMIVNDLGKLPRLLKETRAATAPPPAPLPAQNHIDLDLPYAEAEEPDEQQSRRSRPRRR
jgi:hypothetical protein